MVYHQIGYLDLWQGANMEENHDDFTPVALELIGHVPTTALYANLKIHVWGF